MTIRHVAAVLALLGITSIVVVALGVHYGPGSSAKTARAGYLSTLTKEDLEAFDRFPVLWLGEAFEGLPLTAIQYRYVPAGEGHGPMERVDMVYGDCEPAADKGCPAPVQVSVYPACGPTLADPVKRESLEVRGVRADRYFDGHLALETASNRVVIISARPGAEGDAQAERAANVLRGANGMASSLGVSDDLSAPLNGSTADLAC
jgi:hypothetical protein